MNRYLALSVLVAAAPLAHAQQMPAATTSSAAARAEYLKGLDATANVDYGVALPHLDAAIAADPTFALAHLFRAVTSPTAAQRTEHLRLAAAGRASADEKMLIDAYATGVAGNRDREAELLTTLLTRFPTDPILLLSLANNEQGRGHAAASIAASRRAIAAHPSFAAAYNTLGYALVAAGDMAGAEQAFRDYVRLSPGKANPHDSFGEFYFNQGKLDEAEAQFNLALAADPTFASSITMIARIGIARSSRRFEQAIAAGDADAVAALYTANAIALPPGAPALVGRAAIRADMAAMMAAGIRDVSLKSEEVVRFENTAVERSTITVRSGGAVTMTGKSIAIWSLVNGQWLYVRDMWNWDAPTPGN